MRQLWILALLCVAAFAHEHIDVWQVGPRETLLTFECFAPNNYLFTMHEDYFMVWNSETYGGPLEVLVYDFDQWVAAEDSVEPRELVIIHRTAPQSPIRFEYGVRGGQNYCFAAYNPNNVTVRLHENGTFQVANRAYIISNFVLACCSGVLLLAVCVFVVSAYLGHDKRPEKRPLLSANQ